MIYIGIDPSFSGCGIVARSESVMLLQSELQAKPVKKNNVKRYVHKFVTEVSTIVTDLPKKESTADLGDFQRIVDFRENYETILWRILDCINIHKLEGPIYIGVEIPMGSHMGAGAKLDRAYATILLTTNDVIKEWQEDNPSHYAHLFVMHPTSVKKAVTGKGNAKKEIVYAQLKRVCKLDTKSLNISDAFAITEYIKAEVRKAERNTFAS